MLIAKRWTKPPASTMLPTMVPNGNRSDVIPCIEAQAISLGRVAKQQLKALANPSTNCYVTGQQPAIGGGPLYTLVKISYTIALAKQKQSDEHPIVPIFWCASEDHDLGEAGHADFINRHGKRQRFSHNLGGGRASLRFRPAAQWWDACIAHASSCLGPGLGQAWILDHAPRDNENMGQWTCRLLSDLFSDYGLLCIEGHHLRPLWNNNLIDVINKWPTAELAALRDNLLANGHKDAFGALAHPPLFHDTPSERIAIDSDTALKLISHDSLSLSPGAALRPILQQLALPATAYIGGPGELAYHEFITPIYAALGAPKPEFIPRCSLTIVPAWLTRGLTRWQVHADTLIGTPPTKPTTDMIQSLAQFQRDIDAWQSRYQSQSESDPLTKRLGSGVEKIHHAIQQLHASLERYQRLEDQRPAWGHMHDFVLPSGIRQERIMSLFQVIWEFGPGIVDQLITMAGTLPSGAHAYVELGN